MEWLGELKRRMGMLLNRKQFREDLEAEMKLHVDLRRQQQVERGLSEEDARMAANRRFGHASSMKERSHSAWGWTWLESLVQDTIYGVRAMLRSPGITAVALLSLALGIGANTAIFSVIDAILLRSLSVRDPGRLVVLGDGNADGITDVFAATELYSYPVYRRIQQENSVFSDTAAIFSLTNDIHGYVAGRNQQEAIQVQLVSGNYFQTLGVQPLLGRTINERDDSTEGNHPVAVVSYNWWTRSLGRDPRVLDQTIRIDSTVYSIIGVAPPEFFGTKVGQAPDVWMPVSMSAELPPHWGGYSDPVAEGHLILGRLKPGVTLDQATANINLLFQQILPGIIGLFREGPHVGDKAANLKRAHVVLTPIANGLSDVREQASQPLQILMAVVALVLLIACANIANLLLARSTARARELAVRQALGAARWRIVRQLLTESLVLAAAGGALGIAFASFGSRLLLRMVSSGPDVMPVDVSINVKLLLFALGVTVTTAILFGTLPAVRATRLQLVPSLKDGRGASTGAGKSPLAKALIVSQLAFSLVLLVAAGLFLRTLVNLNRIDSGFNTNNVLLLKTDESSAGYTDGDPRLTRLHHEISERVAALPGVVAESYSSFTFGEGSWNGPVFVQGFDNDKHLDVKHNIVGQGYFATMGVPILAGRGFNAQDIGSKHQVAVISQQMAKTLFPEGSPIGRHYGRESQKNAGDIEVIGVAGDVKFSTLDEPASVHTFDYYPADPAQNSGDFEVRYSGDLKTISAEVQKTIHSIDPTLPITGVETLDHRIASSLQGQRVMAQLCSFFGLLAAFLSSIGIYGLMSYLVSRRTSEIGVRMALGADPAHVRRMVMREIAVLAGLGVAIGVPVTLEGGRLVQSMLYGLRAADPLSVAGATVLLLAVTALAGYLPARRASRVNPVVALRCE